VNLGSIIDGHDDDRVAVLSRGRPTTYGVLRRQVGGLRAGLTELGLCPGDRVAIIASNNRYFVVGYLAVVGAGMVAVPIDPTTPALAVKEELDAVQARALIAGPSARALVTANTEGALDDVEFVIGCGFTPEGGTTFEKLIECEPTDRVELDGDAPAVLAFTSGTAGSPKPAILSHAALSVNIEQQKASAEDRVRADDVTLGVAPLSHIMGLNSVLSSSLSVGASTLLIERFDPVLALESMQKHGVTVAVGPPTMWSSWLNLPDLPADVFASVRIAVSGAARLPEKVSRAFEERFGVRLWEGYGLTEAAPVVCSSYGTDAPHGSVGIPVPGLEVRLVDRDGGDVLIGDPGELLVRGPNVFSGYLDEPEATADALDGDGWLHTGDIAVVDDDGYVFLVDRSKDLIIVSGFNVFPAEVENAIRTHPQVDDCVVVGVPHPSTGESVVAYVVVSDGASLEEEGVIRYSQTRLARYKCPKKIWFTEEVPQDLGGKVLRRMLPKPPSAQVGEWKPHTTD
jgi:long-chain acyl-CoA synthetase